jgi:hypothetical protein
MTHEGEVTMEVERSRSKPSQMPASVSPYLGATPDSVSCSNCGAEIKLTEALARKFEEQAKARMETQIRQREATLRSEAARAVETAVERAEAKVKESLATQMSDLEAQVREKSVRIEQARAVELGLRRNQRDLEEREKALRVEIARQVDVERKKAEQQATERVQEEFRLREAAMKEQFASMTRTIEDLKRKAEQGSQQTQGEGVEVELETVLRQSFPIDDIAPVNKGVRGADIVHTVRTPNGTDCAAIVWETKNAKAWAPKWLEKVREDQRAAKAELAVVVTTTLPPGIRNFGLVEGVWVCDLTSAPVLAVALRAQLQAIHRERVATDGRATKESQLYDYVTGTEFRQRVIAAATTLIEMRHDVNKERNSAIRAFAKRDKQIDCAAAQIVGLYGGAQGIIGGSLKPVALLEMPDDDETASNGDDSTEVAST